MKSSEPAKRLVDPTIRVRRESYQGSDQNVFLGPKPWRRFRIGLPILFALDSALFCVVIFLHLQGNWDIFSLVPLLMLGSMLLVVPIVVLGYYDWRIMIDRTPLRWNGREIFWREPGQSNVAEIVLQPNATTTFEVTTQPAQEWPSNDSPRTLWLYDLLLLHDGRTYYLLSAGEREPLLKLADHLTRLLARGNP